MLVFLDIDGVMVPCKSWEKPELLQDGFPKFSNKATAALQNIISGDVTIMLTTSHKEKYSLNEWEQIFRNRGIEVKKINSLNSNNANSTLTRKEEIVNWFTTNDIMEDFVIVDDDKSLNDLPDYLKSNLILTSSMIGLTQDHVTQIKNRLEYA